MSMMYCPFCDRPVDTDFMDHCQWEPEFKCEDCVDSEEGPATDEEGEPPITWLERASWEKPR